jgi:hypothetical protein
VKGSKLKARESGYCIRYGLTIRIRSLPTVGTRISQLLPFFEMTEGRTGFLISLGMTGEIGMARESK